MTLTETLAHIGRSFWRLGETRAASWEGFNPARARLEGNGTNVNTRSVAGVPAMGLAVSLAAEAVAERRMEVLRGHGVDTERRDGTWQWRLLHDYPNPEQTRYEFWEITEESLSFRGNSYAFKLRDGARVIEIWALHPDQVQPVLDKTSSLTYRITLGVGYFNPLGGAGRTITVPAADVVHIRGRGGSGQLVAPSPVQRFRDSLAATIAQIAHGERVFSKGTYQKLALMLPERLTKDQIDLVRENWQTSQAGPENAGKTAVLAGGADAKVIGMTMADAQFVDAMNLSVEQIARIAKVSPSLLGVQKHDRPISPEHESDRWLAYGLGPRLARIESAYAHDPDFFGRGARDYPRFNTDGVVRGDITTESEMLVREVQSGIRLPDEARAARGLPPLPDGIGQIPQIVPVGGTANPVPVAPDGDPDDPDEE